MEQAEHVIIRHKPEEKKFVEFHLTARKSQL